MFHLARLMYYFVLAISYLADVNIYFAKGILPSNASVARKVGYGNKKELLQPVLGCRSLVFMK